MNSGRFREHYRLKGLVQIRHAKLPTVIAHVERQKGSLAGISQNGSPFKAKKYWLWLAIAAQVRPSKGPPHQVERSPTNAQAAQRSSHAARRPASSNMPRIEHRRTKASTSRREITSSRATTFARHNLAQVELKIPLLHLKPLTAWSICPPQLHVSTRPHQHRDVTATSREFVSTGATGSIAHRHQTSEQNVPARSTASLSLQMVELLSERSPRRQPCMVTPTGRRI